MLKIGDYVKVIGTTLNGANEEVELYPIGTICRVVEIEKCNTGFAYEVASLKDIATLAFEGWWYMETELEKGKLVWVKEE